MAKSLRASSKVKARNARRYGQNTDYAITQAARLHTISQRLAARTKGPTVTEQDNQGSDKEDGEGKQDVQGDDDADSQAMDIEAEPVKKISTSGPRNSRRETWRKARGWKPKQGSKNGGKPKRRR